MITRNKRFETFKSALAFEIGDKAILAHDESVIVLANEFSGQRMFNTLQQAIDHFCHIGGRLRDV